MSDDFRQRVPEEDPFATPSQHRTSAVSRRWARVRAEMERNRRGEHRVPTWALVVAVLLIVAIYAAVVLLAA